MKGKEEEKNRSQAAADSPIQVACLTTLRPVEPVLRELRVAFPTTPDYLRTPWEVLESGGSSRVLPGQGELEICVGSIENLRILFIIGQAMTTDFYTF